MWLFGGRRRKHLKRTNLQVVSGRNTDRNVYGVNDSDKNNWRKPRENGEMSRLRVLGSVGGDPCKDLCIEPLADNSGQTVFELWEKM